MAGTHPLFCRPRVRAPSPSTANRWPSCSQHLQFCCQDRTCSEVGGERVAYFGHLVTQHCGMLLVPPISFVHIAQRALPLRRLSTEHALAVFSGRARPAEGRASSALVPGPRVLHDTRQVVGFKRLCGRVQGGILFFLEKTEKERPQVTRQRGCLSTR